MKVMKLPSVAFLQLHMIWLPLCMSQSHWLQQISESHDSFSDLWVLVFPETRVWLPGDFRTRPQEGPFLGRSCHAWLGNGACLLCCPRQQSGKAGLFGLGQRERERWRVCVWGMCVILCLCGATLVTRDIWGKVKCRHLVRVPTSL